ncbi:hypothetical protein OOZ15_00695 [Galbibacter sp. EGI 63066]|uniref:hypothetical protein n=1 Tax=Galbibacter sp. EGI 63066 TaxID=2993559 RepID=UPI0022493317|nr:hypothetical protein [Galbibacter sp. EGI 63066]MCX2678446.1 hypothetical protein [Galbibacter sp. EGI 63066]
MKKLTCIYTFMAMAVFSCSKDDGGSTPTPPPEVVLPTVEVQESGYNETLHGVVGAPQSGAMIYTIEGTAEEGFKSLEIIKIENGSENQYESLDANSPDYVEGNVQTYTLNYIFSNDDVDKALGFKAVVTDQNDATAEISFGAAKVKNPLLHFASVELKQSFPITGFNADTSCFLHIEDNTCQATSLGQFYDLGYDDKIAMVYSVNDGSGFYLGSPTVVNGLEDNVTNGLNTLATTQFKVQENIDWSDISAYETFLVMNAYDEADFNSHEQKLESANTVGKIFSFKTDDDRIGLVKVTDQHTASPESWVKLDIYITQ